MDRNRDGYAIFSVGSYLADGSITDDGQGIWHLLEVREDRGTAESVCFFMLYYHGCGFHLGVDG